MEQAAFPEMFTSTRTVYPALADPMENVVCPVPDASVVPGHTESVDL